MTPVFITGFSMCNALGTNRSDIVEALKSGRSGLSPSKQDIPFDTHDGAIPTELPPLPDSLSAWSTRTARISQHLLSEMESSLQAAMERWRPERIALIMGTSTAGADKTEDAYRKFLKDGKLPEDYDLWRHHTYGATLHVIRELSGAAGPAWMHSTACTSSAKPLGSAKRLIEAGVIDAAIVGGVDTLCSMTLQGFNALSALSSDPCRPFSADRAGINIGEGGAFLLIEREGNDALARVSGVGESSDAYHIAAPHPDGLGAEMAMQRALEDAELEAGAIDYINAHGTGTRLNDAAESKAIERVFGTDVPVVSTKGYTGHTLGGAGATEIAFSLLSTQDSWIPASLGAEPIDSDINIRIPLKMESDEYKHVLSNSFAFGGNNISVLLSKV
jgi:3-oxoacyl-[acyl-carrier-protein] synthase-1